VHGIYLKQLQIGRGHASDAEALSYLSSAMRSLLQAMAICALEVVRQATPNIDEDPDVRRFVDRFGHPSDGLPVEILDSLIPVIRGLVSRRYMTGWFENEEGASQTLVQALTEWVEFRNKRPGHGVLDAPTTAYWAKRTGELVERILQTMPDALPRVESSGLIVEVGNQSIPISTPLVIDGHALVIGRVVSRKGVWKIHGQVLCWTDAREVTIDLAPSNIFAVDEQSVERFRWSEVPGAGGSKLVLNNVPIRQTTTFVGRKKELDKLGEWLEEIADSRMCLIFGDGGFGKTTLALEFFNSLLEGSVDGDPPLPSVISFYTAKKTKWTEEGLVHFKGISDAMEDSILNRPGFRGGCLV
jgi:hypothetical protein